MEAKCLRACYQGPTSRTFNPDGGEKKDGVYDIDPMDPIATYFEFPKGTKKYHKVAGVVTEGEEVCVDVCKATLTKVQDQTKTQLRERLSQMGVAWLPTMSRQTLMKLLVAEKG